MSVTSESYYDGERTNRHSSVIHVRSKADTPDAHGSKIRFLNKQIRNNDLSQLVGGAETLHSGPKQDIEVREAEKREVVANITMVRKRLDDTIELYKKKDQEMSQYKLEIEKMKIDGDFIDKDSSKTNSRLTQLKNAADIQQVKLEEALMSKKTYESMLERMKKDILVDRMKHKQYEKVLSIRTRELSNEAKGAMRAKQFKMCTENVFDGMLKQVEDQDRKRQVDLYGFEKAVYSKEQADASREDRIRRTENLQEIVAKEVVNEGEKRFRALYQVHKFLHNFLKIEMDAEMNKHHKVEHAFQRLRGAVGVIEPQQFVDKFMKRDQDHNDLLRSITTYEKQVDEAKSQNNQLRKKLQLTKERSANLERQKAEGRVNEQLMEAIFKEFRDKVDLYQTAKTKLERTYAWAIKILVKLDKVQGITHNNYSEEIPKDAIKQAFNKVVEVVRGHLGEIQKNNYSRVLDEIDHTRISPDTLKKDFMARNLRVKARTLVDRRRMDTSGSFSRAGDTSSITDKHQTDQEQDDSNFDSTIEAQRKTIKTKIAQAMLIKKAQEKLAGEAAHHRDESLY